MKKNKKIFCVAILLFAFVSCRDKVIVKHSRIDTRDSSGGGIWFRTDSIVGRDTFFMMVDSQTHVVFTNYPQ